MAEARATRHAYRDRFTALLREHPRLVCIDTDTGLFTGADFGPAADRYINIGIAEHNMMGMAAGLAASGFIPFVNTMATFAATRALEAVKLDIAYPGLPVRIMATHGGLAAGHLGPTHQSLEDLAVMRALPNMTVLVPADAAATEAMVEQMVEQSVTLPGPVYVRLGRKATPPLPDGAGPPRIGRAQLLRAGGGALIVCCGPHPVREALTAAETADAAVLNMHTVKPLDVKGLCAAAEGRRLVVTVEEHWRAGGLGSAVAEALSERLPVKVSRIGVDDTFARRAAGHDALLAAHGITAEAIVAAISKDSKEGKHGHRVPGM